MRWTKRLPRTLYAVPALLFLSTATSSFAVAQQAPPAPTARYVVVLDAAHGGNDSGARLPAQQEKDFTLALSVRLRSLLTARGIQVVTTRESDDTIDLNHRAEIANRAKAQACLSLHASQSGSGIHVYVSALTPVEPARFAAWKTAQAAWVTRSLSLAGVLNSALLHAGMAVKLGRMSLPAVDSMTCPAVVLEVSPQYASDNGSGNADAAALDDPGYQARVAEALAAALLEWRSDARRMETGQP